MVTLNYGETNIPADSYSVRSGGTIEVATAFERSVGLVGGMDTANGTATEGEAVEVSSLDDAAGKFGENSELYDQIDLALQNGAATIYATPVTETDESESVTGSAQGTLDNTPLFNPDLHDDHSITVTDDTEAADVTVILVYTSPSQPAGPNEVEINPITGDWYADESSDYTFDYTHGDYTAAITEITTEEPRIVGVCNEAESIVNAGDTELTQDAKDYVFQHGVYGANPFDDVDSPDIAGFTNPYDQERTSIVSGPYGYIDDAETDLTRTIGAVAGELASLPLGFSATSNRLAGLTGLRVDLSPNQAGDLIDKGVMPLIDYPGVEIVKDMTTSSDARFERVYAMQIADEVVTQLHEVNRNWIGVQPSDESIRNLRTSLRNLLNGLTTVDPPLLDTLVDGDPYAITVERSDTDDNVFEERVGIKPAGVIDAIEVDLVLGDVISINRS